MSEQNGPVDYTKMFDAGMSPAEPVDIPEATEDAVAEPAVEETNIPPVVEETPVAAAPPVDAAPEITPEPTVESEVPDIYGTKFKVDIDDAMKLNLREKAGAGSKVITVLLNNTTLTALSVSEDDPEWLFVQVDDTSETGYVKKLYVTEA